MACNQCYPFDFKNSNTKYKTNGYFPIVLMKLFELNMFELDLNTNLRHLWSVFLLVSVTYVTFFFYEIAYHDFIDYILELTMFPNIKYVIKISIQMMNVHSYI